jgi:hypothetical protein
MDQKHVKNADRNVVSFDDYVKKQDKLLKAVMGEPEYGQKEIKAEEPYVRHDSNIYRAAGIKFQKKGADNEKSIDPALIPNTMSGATMDESNQGFKDLSLDNKVKGLYKFTEKFPEDAKSFAEATDELPDMHNELAELYNELATEPYTGNKLTDLPKDVRTNPASRNKAHRAGIRKVTELLKKSFPMELERYLDGKFGQPDSWEI